jgi:hypothetical protein
MIQDSAMQPSAAGVDGVGIPAKEITYSDPMSIKMKRRSAGQFHVDSLIDMSQGLLRQGGSGRGVRGVSAALFRFLPAGISGLVTKLPPAKFQGNELVAEIGPVGRRHLVSAGFFDQLREVMERGLTSLNKTVPTCRSAFRSRSTF